MTVIIAALALIPQYGTYWRTFYSKSEAAKQAGSTNVATSAELHNPTPSAHPAVTSQNLTLRRSYRPPELQILRPPIAEPQFEFKSGGVIESRDDSDFIVRHLDFQATNVGSGVCKLMTISFGALAKPNVFEDIRPGQTVHFAISLNGGYMPDKRKEWIDYWDEGGKIRHAYFCFHGLDLTECPPSGIR